MKNFPLPYIYMDTSKALDTLDHKISLIWNKQKTSKVVRKLPKNRLQYVELNDLASEK